MPAAVVETKMRRIPIRGGLSGPCLKPIALRAVSECFKAVSVPIIGVGGIMDAEDAISFFMAGARAIQVGSATFADPYAIPKIVEGINAYLDRNGYEDLKQIMGIAHE
jgi:dihydroorotate dehydrogenase (NAD+) catalytic subunit